MYVEKKCSTARAQVDVLSIKKNAIHIYRKNVYNIIPEIHFLPAHYCSSYTYVIVIYIYITRIYAYIIIYTYVSQFFLEISWKKASMGRVGSSVAILRCADMTRFSPLGETALNMPGLS